MTTVANGKDKAYWRGGYTLDDLVKYCDNSGLNREDIQIVCGVYDIDQNGDNKGCKMCEVQNFRLCITDGFLEIMTRKDNYKNADAYYKTKITYEDTGKMLKYTGRGADCYCTTQWEYFDESMYLTQVCNPDKLEHTEWYDVHGIKGDIFHITVGNKTYKNCTWANNRIVRVTK